MIQASALAPSAVILLLFNLVTHNAVGKRQDVQGISEIAVRRHGKVDVVRDRFERGARSQRFQASARAIIAQLIII